MQNELIEKVKDLSKQTKHRPILIAIEGRCASGKTTLATEMTTVLNANVIHMDHFFLPPLKRTLKRENEPGGNVDYERVFELLTFAKENKEFSYQPYDCHTKTLGPAISFQPKDYLIVEGSYSVHPKLIHFYDYKIFVDVDEKTQLERIRKRNGEKQLEIFKEKWIPFEEKYLLTFNIQNQCDYYIEKKEGKL